MTPQISEFSYGFALTHEIANFAGTYLRACPILPSLIEEGKAGGGYDVKLDVAGIPVFLQFKRADQMVRASAKPVKDGVPLHLPFYRFPITPASKSSQHNMLLAMDTAPNEVFYVAPRFHLVSELNDAYLANQVVARSFFMRPKDIGLLSNEDHHVAYDRNAHFVCSDPRKISAINGDQFKSEFSSRLTKAPLVRDSLAKTEAILRAALIQEGIVAEEKDVGRSGKTSEERQLRAIADLSLRYFNAQFIVIQPFSDSSEEP